MSDTDDARGGPVIRAANRDDLLDLVRLTCAFYAEDGFTAPEDDIRVRLERLLMATDAHIAVATDSGASCAFALTTVRLILESGFVAEIQDLFVDPEHRRNGIANALIEDAASWARAQSASLLEVVVAPNGRDVDHLFRFYSARNFTDERRSLLSRVL